ncbi:MAG: hypothetical protein ACTSXP_09600 [Promethearchaeota archaeon]
MQKSEIDGFYEEDDVLQDIINRRIKELEASINKSDFKRAIVLFQELARLFLDQGNFSLSMELIKKAKMLGECARQSFTFKNAGQICPAVECYDDEAKELFALGRYLKEFQEKASEAYSSGDINKAKFYVGQMLAIAEKIGDKELIKNYRKNLKKILIAQKKILKMKK